MIETPLKTPTTFEEQMKLLLSRNLIIEDVDKAYDFLTNVNYYRLSAYMLSYKTEDRFVEGTTFNIIKNTYYFDKKLRFILLEQLESIEVALRTHLSYEIAHKYGATGYLKKGIFQYEKRHDEFIQHIKQQIEKQRREIYIQHHFTKYQGKFPVWVVVEILSLGTLSLLYKNLLPSLQKEIAEKYYGINSKYLTSWLHTLTDIRNICAHHSRLFNKKLVSQPALFKRIVKSGICTDKLFSVIYIMCRLSRADEQTQHFITKLSALIEEYEEIDITLLGLHKDWETTLRDLLYK